MKRRVAMRMGGNSVEMGIVATVFCAAGSSNLMVDLFRALRRALPIASRSEPGVGLPLLLLSAVVVTKKTLAGFVTSISARDMSVRVEVVVDCAVRSNARTVFTASVA